MNDVGIRDYVHAEMLYTKEQDGKEFIPEITEEFVLAWYKTFWGLPEGYYPHLEFKTLTNRNTFSVRVFCRDNDGTFGNTIRFDSGDFFDWEKKEFNNEQLYFSMLDFADRVRKLCK
jgi:hypothetical protein